jgi:outer membrane immunogenic protein
LLGSHWLARAEYRYAGYGHSSLTAMSTPPSTFDFALRTHTVNFGVAYKFE